MKRPISNHKCNRPPKVQKVVAELSKSPTKSPLEKLNDPKYMAEIVTRNTLLTKKVSQLTLQVQCLLKEKEDLADMNSDMIKKNDILEAGNNAFVERLNGKISEIRKMQSSIIEAKENEIRQLESKKEGLKRWARKDAVEIKKMRKENDHLQKEILKLRNDIGRLNVEEASMRRKVIKKEKKIKGLVAELSEESKQRARLWTDLEKKREEVTILNKRIEKADDEFAKLRAKCEKNANELYKLSKRCAKRQNKICKLSDSNELKTAEVSTLIKTTKAQCLELTALRSKLSVLEEAVKTETREGTEVDSEELTRLRQESQEKDAEISWMTRETEIRRDDIARLKASVLEKDKEIARLGRKIKSFKNKKSKSIEIIKRTDLKRTDDVVEVMGFTLPRRKPFNLELIDETIIEVRKMENLLQETRCILVERKLECSICKDREKDRVLNCGHMYCLRCIGKLPNCPTCKKVITDVRTLFF